MKRKASKKEDEEQNSLKKLAGEQPYAAIAAAVEQERCEADLMYEILMHPNHVLVLKDPVTGVETQTTLIDRMLAAGMELIAKKYGPDYGKSRMIADSTAYLQAPAADPTVKLFNLLRIVGQEPEMQALILKGYNVDHPGNLWGPNADIHFAEFVKAVDGMMENAFKWRYSMIDVAHVVRSTVHVARIIYLTT